MINSKELKKQKGIISIIGPDSIYHAKLSTDSRTLQKGEIFIALSGDKFDAFDYIDKICKIEPAAVIYKHSLEREKQITKLAEVNDHSLFIGVEDTLEYLQALARSHTQKWKQDGNKMIIGITGSNGKTTTKEMLFDMLEAVFPGKIHCTQGNFNNHIGVPITLLELNIDHSFAIVELGTNHPGETAHLCGIADPDIGLITNIGSSHLEFFHTEEAIFVEKRELYNHVRAKNGDFVVNVDDPFLVRLEHGVKFGKKGGQYKLKIKGQVAELVGEAGKKVTVSNSVILGNHNFYNLVASFLLASLISTDHQKLLQAASQFIPKNNRSVWTSINETKVFLDAYNANPSSMENAINSFYQYCYNNKICLEKALVVLGDMNELGDHAEQKHNQLGKMVKSLGFTEVVFVGKYAKFYADGYGEAALLLEDKNDLEWGKYLASYEICFIKGSRSLKLETLVQMR